MRIIFINPPFNDYKYSRSQRSPGVISSGTMYYPYWLAHCAALVEQAGHHIYLLDCPADDISRERMVSVIAQFKADVAVMESSTASIEYDLATVAFAKQRFDARYVMVGTHVTAEWEQTLADNRQLSYIAIGEYDQTVVDLLSALENKAAVSGVPALAYREDGMVKRGPFRAPIENMDLLPWIAPIYKRFLKPRNYRFTIATYPMLMLIGGRGCKAKCFYCVYPQVMHGHRYRTRSPAHLVGEMLWIQENMPEIREIVFEDDTFTADREWAREVARLKKARGVTLPFFANIRTNIDRETLQALKDAGLRECATGFESGDETLLVNMRKGQTLEQQRKFMDIARELDLLVHGCFMVGFPGETRQSLQKTYDLAVKLNPDSAQFYPVMPYPGTGAYQWAKDSNMLATDKFSDWLNEDGSHRCVINLPDLDAVELDEFCRKATARFHLRSRYIYKKVIQAIRFPREGIRSVGAFISFISKPKKKLKSSNSFWPKGELANDIVVDTEVVKVPVGRMERVERIIKRKTITLNQYKENSEMLIKAERDSER